jgi:hypothetical protein
VAQLVCLLAESGKALVPLALQSPCSCNHHT